MMEQNGHQETGETMESMMAQLGDISGLRKGEIRTGTVIEERDNGWLVDVGYKCEGFLPIKEWTHRILVGDEEKPQINDTIEVQVVNIREGEEAQLHLSRWRCEFDRRWTEFEDKIAESEIVQVRGLRKVKGGLMVECCGLEGFVPMSLLSADGRGVNVGQFVDQVFEVKWLEKDRRKHRIVFSRRPLVEKEAAEQRAKFYEEVHEGDVIEGEVSSLTDFGIFVNVGALDGLVHVSEISWKRNPRMRETYKKGDKVTVRVIGIDQEANRISLSIKQVEGNPWLTVSERIHKDDVITGPVTNLTDFGAFVELEPGIEGLVHIGDISWARIRHPREVFRKGQEIQVLVLDVDSEKRRISLGYKQLNDPWKDIDQRYAKGTDIMVKVVRLADFGAFVEVEEGVEGLIHISQLSTRRVEKPGDVLQEKQEVLARVIEVSPQQRRMRLSIKELEIGAQKERRPEEGKRHEEHHPEETQQRVTLDEVPQYNPFAEAFKEHFS
ncbi:MAG: S1 RNA-binding domain-containing protein [Fretibacterium sp.]|nr:S1 RNA-binding domain-containing protein [Fretibacterium sp.]